MKKKINNIHLLLDQLVKDRAWEYSRDRYKQYYLDIFPKGLDRIRLPYSKKTLESIILPFPLLPYDVKLFIDRLKYEIFDDVFVINRDNPNNKPIKLGKVIAKMLKPDPKDEYLLNISKLWQKYCRALSEHLIHMQNILSSLLVVISKNPLDVIGMSTNKGWTSCMKFDGC